MLYAPGAVIEHLILPERLSISFLKEKHFMHGKSYTQFQIEKQKTARLFYFLIRHIYFYAKIFPRLFSRKPQVRLQTELELTFVRGVLSYGFSK
jgi:hypothetical protein